MSARFKTSALVLLRCSILLSGCQFNLKQINTDSDPTQDTIKFQELKIKYLVAPRVRVLETQSHYFSSVPFHNVLL